MTRPSTSTSTPPSSDPEALSAAARLAERLTLPIRDLGLLAQALVHSSYPNEHPDSPSASNERLEFLGDAVVSLIVSEALFARHPDEDEGGLTSRRAAIVSTVGLAAIARRMGLGDHLVLGLGADRANERERPSLLAAAVEAIAGAIFLDSGLAAARDWILAIAAPEFDAPISASGLVSPKSRLQELSHARAGEAPAYRIVSAEGPDHAKHYVVEALVGGQVVGRGEGANRREAETAAAAAALGALSEEGR
ncbi:MAG: ribonuclease III [Candidatus Limnocylindrales bacterium]